MEDTRMKAPRTKAKREPGAYGKREKAESDDDRRQRPLHMFGDIGPAIAEADYKPITVQKDPEQSLAAAFLKLGRDYGGPLPADFVLHAVLTPPAAHSSIEATAEAE